MLEELKDTCGRSGSGLTGLEGVGFRRCQLGLKTG